MLNYREPTEADLPRLEKDIANDPYHQGLDPKYWLTQIPGGTKSIAVEDKDGVVFFLRLENVMRAYIQFSKDVDPARTGEAVKECLAFVSAFGKKKGYTEIIFDSVSRVLIRFFKRLGFQEVKDNFQVKL